MYVTAGNIYNWVEKYQKAIPYFEKAISISPKNIDANYGLGLIYYNQALDLFQEASGLNGDEAKQKEDEGLSLLNKALPFLETAFQQDNSNREIKSALLTCYKKLEMNEQFELLKNL